MRAIRYPCQRGHILITSLIIMLLMSIIGANLFTAGWLESRMAASWREDARNFQRLEMGLRIAETTLLPGLHPLDPGPWMVTVNPTLVLPGDGPDQRPVPVGISVFRVAGDSIRNLGAGGRLHTVSGDPDRFRIVASLDADESAGRLSLQAISVMRPGVMP